MNWGDFYTAWADAKQTMLQADEAATRMAEMLKGRLRKVCPWKLAELKRELKDFNPQRRKWKP